MAWKVALSACDDFLANNDHEIDIIFTILDDKIMQLGQSILNSMNTGSPVKSDTMISSYKKSTHEDRIAVFQDTLSWIEKDEDFKRGDYNER